MKKSIYDVTKEGYIQYGSYVNNNRHIPLIFDGLKPSYRRTIYGALHLCGNSNKFIKTAQLSGFVIGNLHPHGDCLSGDTKVYTLEGKLLKLKDIYDSGQTEVEVIAFDEKLGRFVPTIANLVRLGKSERIKYRIQINGEFYLECTGDHKIQKIVYSDPRTNSDRRLIFNKMKYETHWVAASDLKVGDFITSAKVSKDWIKSPIDLKGMCLYREFHGIDIPEGCVVHHIDESHFNNSITNLQVMSRSEHAKFHRDNSINSIKHTHEAMASDPLLIKRREFRNSEMIKFYNSIGQTFNKFYRVCNVILSNGLDITEDSYSKFRPKSMSGVYNAPSISKLYSWIGSNDFKSLIWMFNLISENGLYEGLSIFYNENIHININYSEDLRKKSKEFNHKGFLLDEWKSRRCDIFDSLSNGDIPKDNSVGAAKITSIEIIELDEPEQFFDFTVPEYESMMIPINSDLENLQLINVHNCSINGVISELVHAGIFEGQGNFGGATVLGEIFESSAARYTEVRLDPRWHSIFNDLLPYVEWEDSYIGFKMPSYLPTPIPLSLLFGSLGIGFGTGCLIPNFSARSMIDAMQSDDPYKLCPSYKNIEFNYSKCDFENLWMHGYAYITYSPKVYRSSSSDCSDGIYVETDARFLIPNLDEVNAKVSQDRLFIRDETDENSDKLFIGKYSRIQEDMGYYSESVKSASEISQMYRLFVTDGKTTRLISLRNWIKFTYQRYLKYIQSMKSSKISKIDKDIRILKLLPEIGKYIQERNSQVDETEIISHFSSESPSDIRSCLSKPIRKLMKGEYSNEIAALESHRNQIESIDPNEYTNNILNKM